ncbi:MAG: type II toxin-antitoxin system VapC family toxin [Acidobacteriia bacterium]|nr:type II toxin-antitoxin system VapC family toxin [Terriglobia bacterium]
MTSYVLDASVAAKWFLPADSEPLSAEALGLLRHYAKGDANFLVPDLFFAEIADVLWKAERFARCDAAIADAAIAKIIGSRFPTFPSATLIEPAVLLARAYGRTVCDCIYVALAIQTKTHFITADEKLANSLTRRLPVIWLGAL